MSGMPEKIWAHVRDLYGLMTPENSTWNTFERGTEYIRADLVAGQLMRCHAFYKEQAETCRALIKEALPLWDWDDPEHDPFTAHPFEQNVRTALRYQASEINRLANAQQNIIAEKDAEIERLRKVVEQALCFGYARLWYVGDAPDIPTDIPQSSPHAILHGDDVVWAAEAPELAAYLRERDAVSSTDTRPPTHGVQSGVQEPEEGGQNAQS